MGKLRLGTKPEKRGSAYAKRGEKKAKKGVKVVIARKNLWKEKNQSHVADHEVVGEAAPEIVESDLVQILIQQKNSFESQIVALDKTCYSNCNFVSFLAKITASYHFTISDWLSLIVSFMCHLLRQILDKNATSLDKSKIPFKSWLQ